MAKPGLFLRSRLTGCLLTLPALAVLSPAFLAPTACVSTKACKTATVLVTVSLDAASAMADKLSVAVSVAGAAAKTTTLDHTPGQTSGTVEVDFPAGYPQGQSVLVTLTALRAAAPIGSGSATKTLGGACEAFTVMVTGAGDGGTGVSDAGTGGKPADAGGTGGMGASDAGTGGTGGVGCPAGQNTTCGGVCAATTTDRAHCGATCAVCAPGEVCANGCAAAVAPAFVRVPPDPTGWVDPTGAALTITLKDTGYTNAIYECRTGPDASFTTTTPAWAACDGATGVGRAHTPVPNVAVPEGNYRTEHRYRADSYVSPIVATRYYVHHSLDKVPTCPRAGQAADGPHHLDADYFAAAQAFSTANPTSFPLISAFPAPSAIPLRSDAIYLRNPFIAIPFVGVTQSLGMFGGQKTGLPTSWPATGANYLFNERSLRHSWVLNPTRTMILMKRNYVHPANHCREEIWVGHAYVNEPNPKHLIACEALVVNTHGSGVCLTTGGAAPIPVALEAPANGAGTLTATLNSALVTGLGTNFVGTANQFIQIPPVTGRWYRIAATPVPTAVSITIAPAFAGTTAAGQSYRISPTTTYALPTGFAKMHPDAHNYATGATPPKTPSPKTKCETLGCNAGRPWITYLPP
jgi:hypothetical protein